MPRANRTIARILSGTSDNNLAFSDVLHALRRLGFAERRRGSHVILSREGVREIVNLQPRAGGAAKPYQVRQVRQILLRYGLGEQPDE